MASYFSAKQKLNIPSALMLIMRFPLLHKSLLAREESICSCFHRYSQLSTDKYGQFPL